MIEAGDSHTDSARGEEEGGQTLSEYNEACRRFVALRESGHFDQVQAIGGHPSAGNR